MFRISPWQFRRLKEEFFKGSLSFVMAFVLVTLLFCIGFLAPSQIEVIKVINEDAKSLLSDIMAAFIGVLGVSLAIAAIILSVLQMANKKIQINEIVFKNSFFAPTFYFGFIIICLLSALSIFKTEGTLFKSEFIYQRLIVISFYLFIIFCLGISVVFFKVFRLLNLNTIMQLYFNDTLELVRIEQFQNVDAVAFQLSHRSKEMYQEVREAIAKEDNILLERFLEVYVTTFELNPTSNLITGLTEELQLWMQESFSKNDQSMFYFLVNFWRRLLNIAIESNNENARARLLGLASRIYKRSFNE